MKLLSISVVNVHAELEKCFSFDPFLGGSDVPKVGLVIDVSQANAFYGTHHAVKNVSLAVKDQSTTCLIGTSGSGKTTLLKLINRLRPLASGQINVKNQNTNDIPLESLRRSIGYVVQSVGLFPHLTVQENITLPRTIAGHSRSEALDRAQHLISLFGLKHEDYGSRYPHELSGGQQQRIGIARALINDPEVLLMDEPFGALDPLSRMDMYREFNRLQKKIKKTILLVTHDVREAFYLGDQVALMHEGHVVQVGTKDDFLHRPVNDFVREFLRSYFEPA